MRNIILATLLLAQSAVAQIPGYSSYGIIEHYSGSGPLAGPLAFKVCTQVADDTTPAMGIIPGGCNILETSGANTGATAITTLDGPILPGMMVWIVGTGGAHPTTIADAGNFNLENAWTGETDRVLELYVQGIGDFVESARTGGPRVFDDSLTIGSTLALESGDTITNTTAGDITLTGAGGATNKEDLTWDFETTANTVGVSSSTGVSKIDYGAIDLHAGALYAVGSLSTGGNIAATAGLSIGGSFQLGGGGSIISTAAGDITLAPAAGGDTIIDGTSGDFIINDIAKFAELITDTGSSATEIGTVCASENGTGNVCMGGEMRVEGQTCIAGTLYAFGSFGLRLGNDHYFRMLSYPDDGIQLAVQGSDNKANNSIIIITDTNLNKKHDHDTLFPDPTLFPHSDTSPDADNRQYGKLTHNKSAFELGCGTGYHYFSLDALAANGTVTLTANMTANDAFTVGEENAGAGTQFVADTDFTIGADAATTCANIVTAVNASAEGAHLTANLNGDTVVFEYDSTGVGGNAAILTEDVDAGGVFSVTGAGTMTGGRAAVTGSPGHSPNHYFPGIAEVDGNLYVDGAVQGDHSSSDGSAGITDSTSYWLCTAADCATKCQVIIKDGLITGCT